MKASTAAFCCCTAFHVSTLTLVYKHRLITALIMSMFALLGADPVMRLFAWFSNLRHSGLIIVMNLTSLVVICFFMANPILATSNMKCFVLPAL